MKGKKRCRMHGGKSPGAPRGNKHNLRHGLRTVAMDEVRAMARFLAEAARRDMQGA
ncbi:hypothetical protein [Sphingobium sp. YR768]|uniref:hypothetical protein n=1 Tax=Sphingobium sp. YR768 TaxID=1884365 RepID=UPI0035278BDE